MKWLEAPAALLAWVGRKGTLVVAASIFVGLAVPGLAALARPWLGEALVAMLILAFLRVDPDELRRFFTQPALIAAATAWIMLVSPALLGVFFVLFGLDTRTPDLFFILVLQMAAPGLTSSPALAGLMGLDVALTLATLVVCFALTPFSASFFNNLFLGSVVISPYDLGLKLFLIIAGSAAAALAVRKIGGRAFIEAQRERIDGLSVLAMFLFAVAAMDGVAGHFRADPLLVIKLTGLAFALALGMMALTALIFLRAGRARALAIGIIAGNRNIGVMMAATGFAVPDMAWLYFGLAQFPIYLLPHLLKSLATRLSQGK